MKVTLKKNSQISLKTFNALISNTKVNVESTLTLYQVQQNFVM